MESVVVIVGWLLRRATKVTRLTHERNHFSQSEVRAVSTLEFCCTLYKSGLMISFKARGCEFRNRGRRLRRAVKQSVHTQESSRGACVSVPYQLYISFLVYRCSLESRSPRSIPRMLRLCFQVRIRLIPQADPNPPSAT